MKIKYFYHKDTSTCWNSLAEENELKYIEGLWYKRNEIEITEEQYNKLEVIALFKKNLTRLYFNNYSYLFLVLITK